MLLKLIKVLIVMIALVSAGIAYAATIGNVGRITGTAPPVASANNLTLGDAITFTVSGATQINLLDSAGWTAGSTTTLIFSSTPTVKHNQAASGNFKPILLNGAADLVAAANTVLVLVYDGTQWQECGRKV